MHKTLMFSIFLGYGVEFFRVGLLLYGIISENGDDWLPADNERTPKNVECLERKQSTKSLSTL